MYLCVYLLAWVVSSRDNSYLLAVTSYHSLNILFLAPAGGPLLGPWCWCSPAALQPWVSQVASLPLAFLRGFPSIWAETSGSQACPRPPLLPQGPERDADTPLPRAVLSQGCVRSARCFQLAWPTSVLSPRRQSFFMTSLPKIPNPNPPGFLHPRGLEFLLTLVPSPDPAAPPQPGWGAEVGQGCWTLRLHR